MPDVRQQFLDSAAGQWILPQWGAARAVSSRDREHGRRQMPLALRFPPRAAMPGMMPPQPCRPDAGNSPGTRPLPAGSFPMPARPAVCFESVPRSIVRRAAGRSGGSGRNSAASPERHPRSETGKPRFDLVSIRTPRRPLPFEIPGRSEPEAEAAARQPAGCPPFAASAVISALAVVPRGRQFPPTNFPAPSMPAATFVPSAGGQDFLQSAPAATEEADVAPQDAAEAPAHPLSLGPPGQGHE